MEAKGNIILFTPEESAAGTPDFVMLCTWQDTFEDIKDDLAALEAERMVMGPSKELDDRISVLGGVCMQFEYWAGGQQAA